MIKRILKRIFKINKTKYCYIFYFGRHFHIIKRWSYVSYLKKIMCNIPNNAELIFTHGMGGGVEAYFQNYAKNIIDKTIIVKISGLPFTNYILLNIYQKDKDTIDFYIKLKKIKKYLKKINFKKIKIINLACYKSINQMFNFVKKYKNLYTNTEVHFDIHDYFSVCPSWFLLDATNKVCDANTCSNFKCKQCLSKMLIKPTESKRIDIILWRERWKKFIQQNVDKVVVFSDSSKKIILSYLGLEANKIILESHSPRPIAKYRIGILGSTMKYKGSEILKNIIAFLENNFIYDFHFILIGHNFDGVASKFGLVTENGLYNNNDISSILKNLSIDAIFIPSPWPETFSYTTQESIALSYPTICFNLGGQAEQIKKYKKGLILYSYDPKYIIKEISKFIKKVKSNYYVE